MKGMAEDVSPVKYFKVFMDLLGFDILLQGTTCPITKQTEVELIHYNFWFHVLYAVYGEGNGTPLQLSCLENPMDGGVW